MPNRPPERLRWVLQKIVIPVAVISFSIVVLTASYHYHEQQLNQQLQDNNTDTPSTTNRVSQLHQTAANNSNTTKRTVGQ